MTGVGITAVGRYLPDIVVSNEEVASRCGVSAAWIEAKTGVHERRRADVDLSVTQMATCAATSALSERVLGHDPGLILVATSAPDRTMPSMASLVQQAVCGTPVPAFDLNASCAGFVYGIAVGSAFLTGGHTDSALVVGADALSRYADPSDRRTAALFGDGAVAALLEPVPDGYGVLAVKLRTDGRHSELVTINDQHPAAGEPVSRSAYLQIDGYETRRHVAEALPVVMKECCAEANVDIGEVDRFLFHQANIRMVEQLAQSLDIPAHKVPLSGIQLGNTGAASVGLALALADVEVPMQPGELVLLASIGAGTSAGAILLRWYSSSADPESDRHHHRQSDVGMTT